jgi:UDP-N-acetylmuramoyl-L-alanyl-D-glutamate--2,6-diaminopimelate ligase
MELARLADQIIRRPDAWPAIDVAGLTADSREVRPGFLFAALPGTRADGSAFVAQALGKGAAAILAPTAAILPEVAVPVLRHDSPRKALALMAARFYGGQPCTAVAITGTNGKTSVAAFVREIWDRLGHRAASIGTVGVVTREGARTLAHTTPEPVTLHRILKELADDGITHAALETSSHGLAQCRPDGVVFAAGAFTNISRDHLDYHASFEDYFAQKLRLFSEVLPKGASAVVFADSPESTRVVAVARDHGLDVVTVGRAGETIRLVDWARDGLAQRMTVSIDGRQMPVRLPLVGDFQAANALVAAGLALATGGEGEAVLAALGHLKGAAGRLELVGRTDDDAAVFVDYAHTPDALANALDALRPYATGRLVAVFGCGGDRDRGKRPQMGALAAAKADVAYVTDDNPRSEDPAAIRAEIMAATPSGIDIGDRAAAIAEAIGGLQSGDVLLVAGKGHETGQIVGDRVIPFSDQQVVRDCLAGRLGHG